MVNAASTHFTVNNMFYNRRPKFSRDTTYRRAFIAEHPGYKGYYMCAYCGKIIKKSDMQVDHIIAVNRANKSLLYRPFIKHGNINDTSNMCASCESCNKRKSDHGGLWVFRGKIGCYLQPIIWIITLLLVAVLIFLIITGKVTQEGIREAISNTIAFFHTAIINGTSKFIQSVFTKG